MPQQPTGFVPDGFVPDPATPAHPEAKMSAAAPGLGWAEKPQVTLGDVLDDPIGAIKQIGANVGKEVTDPKLWGSLLLGYFGPKAYSKVASTVAEAAATVKNAGIGPDLAKAAVGYRVGKVIDAAQRIRDAAAARQAPIPQTTPNQVPPSPEAQAFETWLNKAQNQTTTQPQTAPPAAQTAPVAAAPAPAETPAPAPAVFKPGEALQAARDAFKAAGETPGPGEATNAMEFIRRGKSPEEAVKLVLEKRPPAPQDPAAAFTAKFGTPSDADVAADMAKRARSGQKTLMPKYGGQD